MMEGHLASEMSCYNSCMDGHGIYILVHTTSSDIHKAAWLNWHMELSELTLLISGDFEGMFFQIL